MFLSIIFGPALGATAVAGYLLEGALGLPVFAGFSAGVPILLGQTGGYLIGFLPAAIVSGYLAQKGWNKGIKVFCNVLIGTIILFTPGVIMLSHFVGWHRAYQFGVQIFYVTESAKIIFLAGFLNQFNDYFSFLK